MLRLSTSIVGALTLALGSLIAPCAFAQTDLGGQRVATSSGTFLKIGLDARGAALAGAYNAVVAGPAGTFNNPTGILNDGQTTSLSLNYVQWPADIDVGSVSLSHEISPSTGRVAVGLLFLETSFDETTEFHPLGTGRTVGYSDFLLTGSIARNFTDRLAIGLTLKYLREDMGSNIDGPVANGVLLDAGTMYRPGFKNATLAITLAHFGPDLTPNGSFRDPSSGGAIEYTSFSPPTQFQLGFCIDPYTAGDHRFTLATQVLHQADNAETFRGGVEYLYRERVALRTGYDFSADEMGFAAGLGAKVDLMGRRGSVDYAYTEGGNLRSVHRVSLGLGL